MDARKGKLRERCSHRLTSSAVFITTVAAWPTEESWWPADHLTLGHSAGQCFSTFLLQRNLPQMFCVAHGTLCNCEAVVVLQPHGTVVGKFVPGNFRSVSAETLGATRGTPVEKHCPRECKAIMMKLSSVSLERQAMKL